MLDVEIMHPGSRDQCQVYVAELRRLAENYAGRLSDHYVGEHLCLARCHLGREGLAALLEVDYVMEVDRRAQPTFETSLLFETTMEDIGDVPSPPDDAPGVLVLDSGVMGNHPLLQPALGEAAVFPDAMRQRITGGPEDGDTENGHGTSVCGIAVYGDIGRCLETGTFRPTVRLFSARVLDDDCRYDEEELAEHQFEDAVRHFIDAYPECRVINVALLPKVYRCSSRWKG